MKQESGFEFEGRMYPWHLTDRGKDLMLIDRITGMPPQEFFQAVEDEHARGRGPVLLALVGTSLRHGNPDWSLERVVRTVQDLSLAELEFVGGEDEEDEAGPPEPAAGKKPDGGGPSGKGSKRSPEPAEPK